ncbi:GntR family transcriptional regulator [Actinopolymorpha alba]|uniref:GntR family transcriptional regulator n=1 Tax=Actinopolymorpha alba TaxID=533267 RepID=UPI00036CAAC5|nr:GntR family transcriptional regulator [Actinopolymorpha alba]
MERAAGRNLGRPNLKQEAAKFIRDLILSGEVRPGDRLDQDRIAAELGVSRLPVREALIALESEGMVENIARRGAFVASLEPEDFIDHYRMYGLLSGIAAKRAAQAGSPDVIERLSEIATQMRATTDPREHDRLNYSFHQAINKAGSSRRLTAVLRMLSNNMPSHFYEYNSEWEYRSQALKEHDEILDAIKRGDGDSAAAAVAKHFNNTGEQTVRMLRSVGFWGDQSERPAR